MGVDRPEAARSPSLEAMDRSDEPENDRPGMGGRRQGDKYDGDLIEREKPDMASVIGY